MGWWDLIWLQLMMSLLRPPGINILIGILSLYYWIRSSGGKAILLFFISLGLLYGSSIPLVSDKLIIKLESKYKAFKTEDLSQYQNVHEDFFLFPIHLIQYAVIGFGSFSECLKFLVSHYL